MMSNEDPRNLDEYLKNLKKAKQFSKEINAGFSSWGDGLTKIKDYQDAINDRSNELNKLLEKRIALDGKVDDELENQIAHETEKLKLNKAQIKLLKKQVSVWKTLGNESVSVLSKQTQLLKGSLGMYYDIDESVRKTSMSLGLSASRMKTLSTNAQGVAGHFASIGLSSTDAILGQAAFSEEVGRTVMLSQQAMIKMGELGQKVGMSTAEMGGLVGKMEAFGFGSVSALKSIEGIRDTAQGMGVNSSKVIKKVEQNMGLLNKLNFKGGVKGLGRMAAFSEKFKVNMEEIASSAKAVWSPEGAIEAASSLQTLGGGFAKLADPFKLMFDARNDPEKYAESIVNSLEGIAKFDGKDSFGVSAYEMQRLEEAGKALGFSGEKMKEMAIQKAKMDKIGGSLTMFDNEKDREMLAGMVEFQDGKAIIEGESLKGMSDERKKDLLSSTKTREENAKNAMSTREMWTNIMNQVQSTFLPLMQTLEGTIRPMMEALSGFITSWPITTAVVAGLGMVVGKVAEWHMKGYSLGLGFNAATSGKGFFGSLGTRLKSMIPGMGKKTRLAAATTSSQSVIAEKASDTTSDAKKVGKTGGAGKSLKSLAKGLKALGDPKVILGALVGLPATAVGMVAMLPAIPSLLFLGNAPLKKLGSNMFEMAFGLESMGGGKVAFGALNLLLASVGFAAMTVGVVGLTAIALLGSFIGTGLSGLATGLALMGTPPVLLGTLALIGIGAAFLLLGAGIYFLGAGISMIVDSFTNMFSVISSDNIGALLMLGPALLGISLGVMALSASLVTLAVGWALGGWAFSSMSESLASMGTMDSSGITNSIAAINGVDMDKINALKELSTAMSIWGMFGSKPIVVQMEVGGEIKMGGSNGESFDINELSPSQVSELKDLLFQKQRVDSTGGV